MIKWEKVGTRWEVGAVRRNLSDVVIVLKI